MTTQQGLAAERSRCEVRPSPGQRYTRMRGLALTISAMGKTLKPVVVGKATDFGIDDNTGRRLKHPRIWEVPGLGKLGDYIDVH